MGFGRDSSSARPVPPSCDPNLYLDIEREYPRDIPASIVIPFILLASLAFFRSPRIGISPAASSPPDKKSHPGTMLAARATIRPRTTLSTSNVPVYVIRPRHFAHVELERGQLLVVATYPDPCVRVLSLPSPSPPLPPTQGNPVLLPPVSRVHPFVHLSSCRSLKRRRSVPPSTFLKVRY